MALGMGLAAAPVVARLAVAMGVDHSGVRSDMAKAEAEVDKAGKKMEGRVQKVEGAARKAAPAALAIGGALVVGAGKAIGAASDLQESISKNQAVFGKFAKEIPGSMGSVAGSLQMSRTAALEGASSIGAMTKAMGLSTKDSADMSKQLLQLAADMGSFHNADPTDMLNNFRAALSGEAEPMKKYGSLLTANRVKAEALRMGLVKTVVDEGALAAARIKGEAAIQKYQKAVKKYGAESIEAKNAQVAMMKADQAVEKALKGKNVQVSAAAKAQATMSLLMKDTADAHGDAAKTSDFLAGQQRILKAQVEDLGAELGKVLLPAATKVAQTMVRFTGFLAKHKTVTQILLGVLATFVALVLSLSVATKIASGAQMIWNAATGVGTTVMKLFTAAGRQQIAQSKIGIVATKAWAAAQWLLNAAMSANPLVLVVIALTALAIGLTVAYKKSDKFRKIVDKAFAVATKVAGEFMGAAESVLEFFKRDWKKIAVFISGPFAPLVILATDAFGIRSKMIRAMEQLWGRAKTLARNIAGGIKSALMAPIDFAGWLRRQITDKIIAFGARAVANGTRISKQIWNGYQSFSWALHKFLNERVIGPIKSFGARFTNVGVGIGRAIADGFGKAILIGIVKPLNRVITFINTLGDKVSNFMPFVGDIKDIPPLSLPKFARGTIATGPTVGIFGEAGPEALIPMSKTKQSSAIPLLKQAAAAHGMGLMEFGFGGVVKGAVGRFNPAKAGSGVINNLLGGAGALAGKLPGIPDHLGPRLDGKDVGRQIAKHVLGKTRKYVTEVAKGALAKINPFGGGGGGGGSARRIRGGHGVFPVLGGSLGGGPAAHRARALGNWQSDDAWDIMGREGTPVLAAMSGVIGRVNSFINQTPGFWGGSFYQDVPGGQLWYKHLRNIFVRPGQHVQAGDVLGLLGGTGVLNGGPHLHLGANPLSLGYALPGLDTGGTVTRAGIAQVHPGDVHMGRGNGSVNIDLRGAQFIGSNRDVARQLAQEIGPYLDQRVTLQVTG